MSIELQLKGYRLATVEITYRMPDHLSLLQTFIWQLLDLSPDFPEIRKFLNFWEEKIDGPLYSVKVGHVSLITPPKWRAPVQTFTLH